VQAPPGDSLQPEATGAGMDLCRDFFSRAAALKLSFFEAAYEFS
jgi:hypothetical protein